MTTKHNIYEVHVEDRNIGTSYMIRAASAIEARTKAKKRFIKDYYIPSRIKTSITSKITE